MAKLSLTTASRLCEQRGRRRHFQLPKTKKISPFFTTVTCSLCSIQLEVSLSTLTPQTTGLLCVHVHVIEQAARWDVLHTAQLSVQTSHLFHIKYLDQYLVPPS